MTQSTSSPASGLNVAIIGAGLAGALAARVLREGHNVTVFERGVNATEVGAAINIGPNGVRILDTLGFDRLLAGSMPVGATKVYDDKGNLMLEKYPSYFDEYGADWLFHHRSDLRNEFVRLATVRSEELGVGGMPAQIGWGCGVKDVDAVTGRVTLSTGEVHEFDLVIAADGIKSVVREVVVGDSAFTTARPSGLSAFRFTLEAAEVLKAFGELPEILQKDKPVCLTMLFSMDGSKRGMVLYPCRHFELLNFVCIVPDSALKGNTTESWSAVGDAREMVSILGDFPDWAVRYMKLVENVKLWQLRDQDPLPTYVRGRTVLVGDAAHAMTPHQGQGGTQAVEDAEGFRLFLKPGITRDDVPAILKDYDSVRRIRASQIQINTRQSQEKRTPQDVYRFEKYNWTYPGIVEGLARVKGGVELIQF